MGLGSVCRPVLVCRDDRELAAITRKLGTHLAAATNGDALISQALEITENIGHTYRNSPEHIRRLFNQLIFERLDVVYDQHEGEWKLETSYTPEFAILGDGRIRIVAAEFELESKKLTNMGEFSLDLLPETLFYDVISSCKSTVVGAEGLEPPTPSV